VNLEITYLPICFFSTDLLEVSDFEYFETIGSFFRTSDMLCSGSSLSDGPLESLSSTSHSAVRAVDGSAVQLSVGSNGVYSSTSYKEI